MRCAHRASSGSDNDCVFATSGSIGGISINHKCYPRWYMDENGFSYIDDVDSCPAVIACPPFPRLPAPTCG